MRPIARFRRLERGKDSISAAEWNALVTMVENLYRGSMSDGIMDSTGFHPRRRPTPQNVRIAYCKTDAGTGSTLQCFLDTDGSGQEVTVHFQLLGGITNLSDGHLSLVDGTWVPVMAIENEWRCIVPIEGTEDCS